MFSVYGIVLTVSLAQEPVAASGPAEAQPVKIYVRNDTGRSWRMLLYSEATKKWNSPPPFLPATQVRGVDVRIPGRYFVSLRDDGNREQQLNWCDFGEYGKTSPTEPLELSNVAVKRVREEQVTIMTPEKRTKTVRKVVNGRYVNETVEYTVMVPRASKRMIEYTVQVPVLQARLNGELIAITPRPVDAGTQAPAPAAVDNKPQPQ